MSDTKDNTKQKNYHHVNQFQRGQIAALLELKVPKTQIAKQVGIARSTLYEEIKRGTVEQKKSDLTVYKKYFPDTGQLIYEQHRKNCHKPFKFLQVQDFLKFAEEKILIDKWSPDAVVGYARCNNLFPETICTSTLYHYIDLQLTKIKNIDLKQKLRRKPKRNYSHKYLKKLGTSIDLRPPVVDSRLEFGHWEIDLILGKLQNDSVLLTLDERMTRFRHIIKLPSKKAECVVAALKSLQTFYGDKFVKVFKSITSDNGSEFASLSDLSVPVYYAHPYSAWERGTNERQNGLVRFFIPKSHAIRFVSDETVSFTQRWINSIPRKIFNYQSSEQKFFDQLNLL